MSLLLCSAAHMLDGVLRSWASVVQSGTHPDRSAVSTHALCLPALFDSNLSAELQLVFLYRFLSENLTYISTMLAMRPPPLEFGPSPGAAPVDSATAASAAPEAGASGTPAASSAAGGQEQAGSSVGAAASTQAAVQAATSTAQAPVQPFVLLMDVRASAPNIRLPRSSGGSCYYLRCCTWVWCTFWLQEKHIGRPTRPACIVGHAHHATAQASPPTMSWPSISC